MGCTDERNTNSRIDITTDRRMWMAPFLSNFGREKLKELLGFMAQKTINRCNEGNKIILVVITCRLVFTFLGFLTR